jgi:small subunit ribosomal protein S6
MTVQSSSETKALSQADSLVNGYEFMFILDPTLDDAASLAVVERVEGIVKGQGGEIVSLKPWERRRLAYPIAGHHEGLYILCYFDAPPASISGIESRVRLAEGVLRFIVLRTDRETRERDQAADLRRREERAARAAAAAAEAAARESEEAAEAARAPRPDGAEDADAPKAPRRDAADRQAALDGKTGSDEPSASGRENGSEQAEQTAEEETS